MRTVVFAAFFLLALTCVGNAQSKAADEEHIKTLSKEFETFLTKGDSEGIGAWMDKHLTEDFSCVTLSGRVADRQQMRANYVAFAKRGASGETSEEKLRIIGNTAIETSLKHSVVKSATGQTRDITFRSMDVWVRENGEWKMSACAGTPVVGQPNSASSSQK